MRVALVAESFLPHMNGVTHSLLRALDHLEAGGHEAIVIAPDAGADAPTRYGSAPVARVPAFGLPGYRDVRVSVAAPRLVTDILDDFRPDVVHLASPIALGWTAMRAANELGLPTVAVYQTDVAAYADSYGVPWGQGVVRARLRAIHGRATLTLAPSSSAIAQLERDGIPRVRLWARGVDSARFHPRKRDDVLRAAWAPGGETVVGYVGRLAPEKRVADLAAIADLPGTRLVVVGAGPSEAELRGALPSAVFTGALGGEELARAFASLDVFVHCGELETFGQTLQEAHASRVPVVAPARGGPVDVVEHGASGFLYRPGDLGDLRARVRALAGDAAMRARMGERGRRSALTRSWETLCAQLMGHYDAAIAAHAVPAVALPRRRALAAAEA